MALCTREDVEHLEIVFRQRLEYVGNDLIITKWQ